MSVKSPLHFSHAAILLLCAVFAVVFTLLEPRDSGAELCVNCLQDRSVKEGDPVDLPLFFLGGDLAGKPIELFVWKEAMSSFPAKQYLGPEGKWVNFSDFTETLPLGEVEMPELAALIWRAYDVSEGMKSFTLYICLDSATDQALPQGSATATARCGSMMVNIIPKNQPSCSGVFVYDSTGAAVTSLTGAVTSSTTVTKQLTVKDSCGSPVQFSAAANNAKISVTPSGTGSLTVTLGSSSSDYTGAITVSSATSSATVSVAVDGSKSSFTIGGGTTTCTPSSLVLWPPAVTLSAASGQSASGGVSVSDNCGKAVSFTTTVTSITGGSWLSLSGSSGYISAQANTTGMSAGTNSATVHVSSGSLSADLQVSLTIAGQCVPSQAVISPGTSYTKTVGVGTSLPDEVFQVKDNCGNPLAYSVTSVTAPGSTSPWITAPAAGATGTGSFTVSFAPALPAGSYQGSLVLNAGTFGPVTIQFSVTVSTGSSTARLIASGGYAAGILAFTINPGEIQYYYFEEHGVGPNPTQVNLEDASQSGLSVTGAGLNNVEMIVRYAGPACDDSKKPTVADYEAIKAGTIKSGPPAEYPFYFALSGNAFERVIINPNYTPNPLGCFFIMVYNVSAKTEMLNLYYVDFDSM